VGETIGPRIRASQHVVGSARCSASRAPASAQDPQRCQGERVSHVHHHRQANDFRRTVEISAGIAHGSRLPQPRAPRTLDLTLPRRGIERRLPLLFAVALAGGAQAIMRFAVIRTIRNLGPLRRALLLRFALTRASGYNCSEMAVSPSPPPPSTLSSAFISATARGSNASTRRGTCRRRGSRSPSAQLSLRPRRERAQPRSLRRPRPNRRFGRGEEARSGRSVAPASGPAGCLDGRVNSARSR
jgi:hypothetical protein